MLSLRTFLPAADKVRGMMRVASQSLFVFALVGWLMIANFLRLGPACVLLCFLLLGNTQACG